MRFFTFFLFFGLLNFLARGAHLSSFGFLNEDTALIRFAVESINREGFLFWFSHSYGPSVLRPWQLFGLYIQEYFFHGVPLGFHLFSLVVFSLAQAILLRALIPVAGTLGPLLAIGALGFVQMGAEPLYWVSDQHDLYLFLFLALALLCFQKAVLLQKYRALYVLLFFVMLWGAFLSNEKAVLLPVFFSLYALYLWYPVRRIRAWLAFTVVGVSFVSFVLYFLYRYSILGQLIGGYGTGILPDRVTVAFVQHVILSVLFTPVRQFSEGSSLVAGWVSVVILIVVILLLFFQSTDRMNKKTFLVAVFLGVGTLLLSALPTLRYLLPPSSYCVFSTRLHWLILVVFTVQLALLFGAVFRRERRGWTARIAQLLVFCYVALMVCSFRVNPRKMMRAARFAGQARTLYQEHCSCAFSRKPQTKGLPIHFATANVFTEAVWIEEDALYSGMPKCEQASCKLRYYFGRKGKLRVKSQQIK